MTTQWNITSSTSCETDLRISTHDRQIIQFANVLRRITPQLRLKPESLNLSLPLSLTMAVDKDAGTPRVFLARHGQTEWTINGRWTGSTADIPLTQFGESQISSSAQQVVGPGKLIDPEDLALVFVSPMQRARKTYELMFEPATRESFRAKVDLTKDLVEWGYGDYEGLSTAEIKQLREQRGLNAKDFDVFKHGCEGGEYVVCCNANHRSSFG